MNTNPKISQLDIEPTIHKIVVLRALQLGDLLCCIPTLRAIRAALPDAHITLIGLPWAAEFVDRYQDYLDDFIEFPGFPGLPERAVRIAEFPAFLSRAQARQFDLAIQLHGSGQFVNPLTVLFGARQNAGFYLKDDYCPDPDHFLIYPDSGPEISRLLHILDALGINPQGTHLEFPLKEEDYAGYRQLEAAQGLQSEKIVCIHPGSRDPLRRWPVEWFAKSATLLAERGYQVVLTGTRAEAEITNAVASQAETTVINLAGKTNLGVLGVLLSRSHLLICNDTGVSHLADALQVPSIVLFTTSDPQRWAPLDRQLHRIIPWASNTSTDLILEEIDQLLEQERPHVG